MTRSVTPAELAALAHTTKGAKYGNTRGVWVEELQRRFDSLHEADVAVGLRRREQAGEVRDLEFQPRYRIGVNGQHICDYVADFTYLERVEGGWWKRVVADAKGVRTPMFRVKAKLMRAVHAIDVKELSS